jgi:DNA invertase Pin-like site-specific DNA recombinase
MNWKSVFLIFPESYPVPNRLFGNVKENEMTKLIAYLRVSTNDQAENGVGLDAQLDACQTYADRVGIELGRIFKDEGVSGGKELKDRPALLEAISILGRNDILVVAKRDRLGRDPIAVAMIERAVLRKGGRIVSAAGEGTEGDDPSNVLMRRMIDAFAEYERLIIGARTKAALQSKIRRGERVGQVRYGFRLAEDGKRLIPEPKELEIIDLACRLRKKGLTLRRVSDELTKRGYTSRVGKSFGPKQVWVMVGKGR